MSEGEAPRVRVSVHELKGVPERGRLAVSLNRVESTFHTRPKPRRDPRTLVALLILAAVTIFAGTFSAGGVLLSRLNSRERDAVRLTRVPRASQPLAVHRDELNLIAPTVYVKTNGFWRTESEGTAVPWKLTTEGTLVLVTNAHVVEDASESPHATVEVEFASGVTRKAIALGVATDLDWDFALLVVEAKGLKEGTDYTVVTASGVDEWSGLRTGDAVVAVGSPHGYPQTQTFGNISALRTNAPHSSATVRWIQFDATVLPGNSGGPLLASVNGEWVWIGVVTMRGEIGIGFAVHTSEIANATYEWVFGEPPNL